MVIVIQLEFLSKEMVKIPFKICSLQVNTLSHLICNHFSRKVQKSGSRKVVRQTQIFFSGQLEKSQIYGIKPPFFLVNHFSRTRFLVDLWSLFFCQPLFSNQIPRTIFLEPDFLNQISQTTFLKPLFDTFLEKWLQIIWSSAQCQVQCPLLKNESCRKLGSKQRTA